MRPAAALVLSALALAACQKGQEPTKAQDKPIPVTVVAPQEPAPPPAAAEPAPAEESAQSPEPTPIARTVPSAPEAAALPAGTPAAKPAAGSPFAGGFDLVGTEPFWNMQIRDAGLKLTRPDHADLTAANPGYTELGQTALWTANVGQSRMVVTVTKAACSDGMSDRTYPYSAKVKLWGATLSGCAKRAKG